MKLLPGLSGAKPDGIHIALWLRDQFCRVIDGQTERINDMRFGQASRFAQCRRLVAEERRRGGPCTKCGIQVALALHRPLSNLIQVSAYPGHLQGDFPLMELVMTWLAQGQQVGQRILATMLPIHHMMSFQATVQLPALLALIAVSHQAGDAQIFIQARRILVLTAFQVRVVETGNVYLNVFYHDV